MKLSHTLSIFMMLTWLLLISSNVHSAPETPVGLCINNATCSNTSTSVNFFPGFIIASNENQVISALEKKWHQLFKGSRSETYRPEGVYGGIARRLHWKRFYKNDSVRPTNPRNPRDAAYDWSLLDQAFQMDPVKNDGAMVFLEISEVGFGGVPVVPRWLHNAPYNGTFPAGTNSKGLHRITPRYDRPKIVEEFIMFHEALYEHLKQTGNLDKLMGVGTVEFFLGNAVIDFDVEELHKGAAQRIQSAARIWVRSAIPVYAYSLVNGTKKNNTWPYLDSYIGMGFPDVKMISTHNPQTPAEMEVALTADKPSEKTGLLGISRFSSPSGSYQILRPLIQHTETNGVITHTYFHPDTPNPWNYSGQSVKQTPEHILWAFSGRSKNGTHSAIPGIWPVHTMVIHWCRRTIGNTEECDRSSDLHWKERNLPSVQDWRDAIDKFGPPGTFQFPYIPGRE